MDQALERQTLRLLSSCLVSLPFDLKVLFEAKDDPELDRSAREIACGAILYVLTGSEVVAERNIIGYADDCILVRLAFAGIAEQGGEGAEAFRSRFAEQYQSLDADLGCLREFLGPELYGWLAGKAAGLAKLSFKGKRVGPYVDDEETMADLYDQGLTFQTDYELTEQLLADKFKQLRPILEHLQKRRAEEAKKIS